jgi:hypothetical protein
MDKNDHMTMEKEALAGSPQAEDDMKELRASMDAFLGVKPRGRAVDAAYRERMHRALDAILAWNRRRCTGDRAFQRRQV